MVSANRFDQRVVLGNLITWKLFYEGLPLELYCEKLRLGLETLSSKCHEAGKICYLYSVRRIWLILIRFPLIPFN